VPPIPGWRYIRIDDPFDAARPLLSVVRGDGKEILLGLNAWQTAYISRDTPQPEFRRYVHLFDRGGDGVYTFTFAEDVTPPTVLSWNAVAAHGDAMLGLPLAPGALSVEPRQGGLSRLVLSFSEALNPATLVGASVAVSAFDASGEEVYPPFTPSVELGAGNQFATVTFTPPLPENLRYCIRLVGVRDLAGNLLAQGTARIDLTLLVGDVTGDGRVTVNDAGALATLLGTDPIDPTNLFHVRSDLDRNGRIDGADLDLLLAAIGGDFRHFVTTCLDLGPSEDASQPAGAPTTTAPPGSVAAATALGGRPGAGLSAWRDGARRGDGDPRAGLGVPGRPQTIGRTGLSGAPETGEVLWDLVAFRDDDAGAALVIAEFGGEVLGLEGVAESWRVASMPATGPRGGANPAAAATLLMVLDALGVEVGVVVDRGVRGLAVARPEVVGVVRNGVSDEWGVAAMGRALDGLDVEEIAVVAEGVLEARLTDRTGLSALDAAGRLSSRREFEVVMPRWVELRWPRAIGPGGADEGADGIAWIHGEGAIR
jgi:hypothetical protein